MISRILARLALAVPMLMAFAAPAGAQETYPARPIRLVVPYAAGGNTDALARLIAQRMSSSLGQQVVVDNRPGGETIIGSEFVARAPADGYTLLLTTLTLTTLPSLHARLPFDPANSFTPISMAVTLPTVLVVNPSLPVRTLPEFIAYAKANPGKVSYASTGTGTSPHLSMVMLQSLNDFSAAHVPYKGGGPAMTDLLGNHIDAQFVGLPVALPHVRNGKLRALAVTGNTRSAALPNVPAMSETMPNYTLDAWFGLLGPAKLPADIVDRLHGELVRTLNTPELRQQLATLGAEPVGSTPAQFAALIRAEIPRYQRLIKDANIKVE